MLVLGVHVELEQIHVADDQAGQERAEVAAVAGAVERDVGDRDDGQYGDRRRLAPDAGSPAGHGGGQQHAGEDADDRAMRELGDEVDRRAGDRSVAGDDDAGHRQRQHRAGGVVERRLGDHGLREPRAQTAAEEQRDQDRRVGGGEHGADQQRVRPRQAEREVRGHGGDRGAQDDAGDHEHAEAECDAVEHPQREVQPAVEEDRGDAEREQQLRPDACRAARRRRRARAGRGTRRARRARAPRGPASASRAVLRSSPPPAAG